MSIRHVGYMYLKKGERNFRPVIAMTTARGAAEDALEIIRNTLEGGEWAIVESDGCSPDVPVFESAKDAAAAVIDSCCVGGSNDMR